VTLSSEQAPNRYTAARHPLMAAKRVRLLVTDEQGQPPSVSLSADPDQVPVAPDSTALLFLALFVGTGWWPRSVRT
jgi:hypothetical protein